MAPLAEPRGRTAVKRIRNGPRPERAALLICDQPTTSGRAAAYGRDGGERCSLDGLQCEPARLLSLAFKAHLCPRISLKMQPRVKNNNFYLPNQQAGLAILLLVILDLVLHWRIKQTRAEIRLLRPRERSPLSLPVSDYGEKKEPRDLCRAAGEFITNLPLFFLELPKNCTEFSAFRWRQPFKWRWVRKYSTMPPREVDCAPGPASQLPVDVRNRSVKHTLSTRSVENWLNRGARNSKEAIENNGRESAPHLITRVSGIKGKRRVRLGPVHTIKTKS
jgi:hypothetical protein